MNLTISQLWIYPIKSCQGISLPEATLLPSGLQHDRCMMIIDEKGQFVTQRSHPVLATISVALMGNALQLSHNNLSISFTPDYTQAINTAVWQRNVPAFDQGNAVAHFLSTVIEQPVRLVATRPADTLTAQKSILFQDGQAIHLITEASLQHAQSHLTDYDMDARRFRPNIVIADSDNTLAAFAEDYWQTVQTDFTAIRINKRCERCNIPSIHPDTLTTDAAVNHYLQTHRLIDGKPLFGICGTGTKLGKLRVGDAVHISSTTV